MTDPRRRILAAGGLYNPIQTGTAPAETMPAAVRKAPRQELYDLAPPIRIIHGGFTRIATDGNIPAAPATDPVWFKLDSITPDVFGTQDFALVGIETNQLACNTGGTDVYQSGLVNAAWGQTVTAGTSSPGFPARLLFMKNGPGPLQVWFRNPLDLPTADELLPTSRRAEYIRQVPFPPGQLSASPPPSKSSVREFSPDAFRFGQGDRLDCYLVIGTANTVAINAAEEIQGYADFALKIRLPLSTTPFRE